jgi:tryptophan-rich sensory protein
VSSRRAITLVWLLLATLAGSLALRAWRTAPKGSVFVGTFNYVDDFYNYLSSVEQAQRGALLFRSKLVPPQQPPALLNLEWLTVGWLAALLGGRPLLAYRIFGLGVLLALVAATERWLARCGVPPPRRLAALLLVFTGGGLGGVLVASGRLTAAQALDVRTGAFPFAELITNPHFLAGTTLLATALAACADGRPRAGALLGAAAGLVRPYDAALFLLVELVVTVTLNPLREWRSRLLPLAAVVPVLAYDGWLFLASPGFRVFSNPAYASQSPSLPQLALALGPAVALALTAWPAWRQAPSAAREHLARLALWAAAALAIVALKPVSFSLQLLVGAGLPLLVLAGVGLARRRVGLLEAAVPAMGGTAALVSWMCTLPAPPGTVPAERWQLARALHDVCRPGELVIAPADIGLYVGGLTPCWPYVSHPAAPDYPVRIAAVSTFYDAGTPPGSRALWLDESCAAHVVVPAPLPPGWLGGDYAPRFTVGEGASALAVWSRDAGRPCAAAASRAAGGVFH